MAWMTLKPQPKASSCNIFLMLFSTEEKGSQGTVLPNPLFPIYLYVSNYDPGATLGILKLCPHSLSSGDEHIDGQKEGSRGRSNHTPSLSHTCQGSPCQSHLSVCQGGTRVLPSGSLKLLCCPWSGEGSLPLASQSCNIPGQTGL